MSCLTWIKNMLFSGLSATIKKAGQAHNPAHNQAQA
jgi:hypothetical protein